MDVSASGQVLDLPTEMVGMVLMWSVMPSLKRFQKCTVWNILVLSGTLDF